MKRILLLAFALVALDAQAGMRGWLTSEARDWAFIKSSGGIHVGIPVAKDDKKTLPVEYWPSGNSGLSVRKIELKRQGEYLVLRVFTQAAPKDAEKVRFHHLDLAGIPAGKYEVYYETPGDVSKFLGRVEIK